LLTAEQKLGLECPWWLYWYEDEEIDKACRTACLKYWMVAVMQAFRANQHTKRPGNWTKLAEAVRRHPEHIRRLRSQKRVPQTLLLYSCSSALQLSVHELIPPTPIFVGDAAFIFTGRFRPDAGINRIQARLYGRYVFCCEETGSMQLDGDALTKANARRESSGDREATASAIQIVAQTIGDILSSNYQWLLSDR
jgi:hypothetical protein